MTPVLARRLGNDRAFERLYRKHAGDVYRYALVVLRNQADAEDVTQTTFMNAYRAFEKGERPQKPQNWLIAIAHNVCRQRFRQAQRRPAEVGYEDELAESVVEEDAVTAEDIRRALGHLAFNQRSALVMRELEGRSYPEIAEILGVSVSAVETLLFRARRALREQLEQSISCQEAELAISRQLDGRLPRNEKGALRAHLRECDDCAGFARSQRAHRGALKALGAIPLPGSLAGLFGGGGGAAVGGGLAFKAAALTAGALLATGVGYEGVKQELLPKPHPAAAAAPIAKQRANRTVPEAVVPATAFTAPQEARHDQQPFRRSAVDARKAHPAHPVTPAVSSTPAETKAKPSRERAHDLKPFKPTHVTKPNPGLGHAKQPVTKPPKPAPRSKSRGTTHTGGSGRSGQGGQSGQGAQGGQGKGKTQGQAQAPAAEPTADATTRGKSGH
ncbi:MAG TPA: sigma-70 family RNA polymerase sigma factor [Gaiellaceae bacterium]|nr:sigma-70 family RNA polymerase sigma factor [Gaiellaceae bacterium]